MVWYGMVSLANINVGQDRRLHGASRYGMAWHGMVWHGEVWYGMALHDMVWYGMNLTSERRGEGSGWLRRGVAVVHSVMVAVDMGANERCT